MREDRQSGAQNAAVTFGWATEKPAAKAAGIPARTPRSAAFPRNCCFLSQLIDPGRDDR